MEKDRNAVAECNKSAEAFDGSWVWDTEPNKTAGDLARGRCRGQGPAMLLQHSRSSRGGGSKAVDNYAAVDQQADHPTWGGVHS